jgi:hypothetical protein
LASFVRAEVPLGNAAIRLASWLTTQRCKTRRRKLQSGTVTAVQRVNSDFRPNPHLHVLALDGVFVEQTDGSCPEFRQLPHLRSSEVADLVTTIRVRSLALLVRRGVIEDSTEQVVLLPDELAENEPVLAQVTSAAVSGLAPAGPERREREPLRLARSPGATISGALCAADMGFTVHAATLAPRHDARAKEALLRYILRPPLAQARQPVGRRCRPVRPQTRLLRWHRRRGIGSTLVSVSTGRCCFGSRVSYIHSATEASSRPRPDGGLWSSLRRSLSPPRQLAPPWSGSQRTPPPRRSYCLLARIPRDSRSAPIHHSQRDVREHPRLVGLFQSAPSRSPSLPGFPSSQVSLISSVSFLTVFTLRMVIRL